MLPIRNPRLGGGGLGGIRVFCFLFFVFVFYRFSYFFRLLDAFFVPLNEAGRLVAPIKECQLCASGSGGVESIRMGGLVRAVEVRVGLLSLLFSVFFSSYFY